MNTKLITSLDELVPGMKTKDGWELKSKYKSPFGHTVWGLSKYAPDMTIGAHFGKEATEKIFLGQEVEVPE